MNVLKNRAVLLLSAVAIAGTACSGSKGDAGPTGQQGPAGTNVGALSTSGLAVAVKGVTVNADQTVSVEFTVKDDQGFPVDLAGKYSTNAVMTPRFSLSQINVAADGTMLPYTVLTKNGTATYTTTPPDPSTVTLNPTALSPADYPEPKVVGKLVENGTGAGDYTYTFPAGGSFQGPGAGYYAGKNVVTVSSAVTVDPKSSNTYVLWIEAARQTNLSNTNDPKGFKAVNFEYDFIPSGSGTPLKRQVAATADCTNCHRAFRPMGTVSSAFHGGTRVEAAYCDVCHSIARVSTPTVSDGKTAAAFSGVFVHRIHASEEMLLKDFSSTGVTTGFQGSTACTTKAPCTCTPTAPCTPNSFHGISDVTYPQDLRACGACHKDAAQGAQSQTTASRAVCGSCHDFVVFDPATIAAAGSSLPACVDQSGNQAKDANGNWLKCAHAAGANTDDNSCKGCHVSGGAGYIGNFHVAVALPDPTNSLLVTGGNTHTNQMYVAAAGTLPPGAIQFKYIVSQVTAVADAGGVLRPQITFKFQQSTDGTNFSDVVFNTFGSGKTELLDNFVGSPSVYFAFAVPQDGIQAPADFNATASAYIKAVWNGSAAGTTMTGPVNGFYTIALTGSVIPPSAKMLTGGVGYSYGTTSSQPMTQTNLPAYPYNWDPYGKKAVAGMGGLAVPAPNVWAVATGNDGSGQPWAGRRAIVDNARCLTCHAALGVNPTFHAGQRNDGPTCSFCHTPNKVNGGWAVNGKYFIHAIHAGDFRTTPFPVDAPNGTWAGVTFPGPLNNCDACHAPGTYDFSASASAAAVNSGSLIMTTTTTGTITAGQNPFVPAGNYGNGYATSGNVTRTVTSGTATTGTQGGTACSPTAPCTCTTAAPCTGVTVACSLTAPCDADPTTLVISPITAACVACHDSPAAKGHMVGNGGQFYGQRSALTTQASAGIGESCLLCHGAGGIAPIADVHK